MAIAIVTYILSLMKNKFIQKISIYNNMIERGDLGELKEVDVKFRFSIKQHNIKEKDIVLLNTNNWFYDNYVNNYHKNIRQLNFIKILLLIILLIIYVYIYQMPA